MMGFPNDVSERALIDCGRHCCLCHKFCGTKIELHHIKQKADGGKDTYENCIPLCFDCHAEVKAYNPKHPKGRAYSESELKQHRYNWYLKVKQSGGISTNVNYVEMDKKIFDEIRNILKSDGVMAFLKDHDFGYKFKYSDLNPLDEFCYLCQRPEFEFIDIDLEGLRVELYELIKEFNHAIAYNTFPINTNEGSVLLEWKYEQSEYFIKIIDTIHDLTEKIWHTYCQLIKLGRRKLGI